jgi:hypothetical protein
MEFKYTQHHDNIIEEEKFASKQANNFPLSEPFQPTFDGTKFKGKIQAFLDDLLEDMN